jgi:hypothetical protein
MKGKEMMPHQHGKKDDEDERAFARRCLLMAHSMYKQKTVKRGFHR